MIVIIKQILFLAILVSSSMLFGAAKIAVTTKVMGNVKIETAGNSGFSALKPGTILTNGDRIKTGNDGFAALIYIDDKSVVKIKENTELTVKGTRKTGSIAKQVDIDSGTLRAQVSKQRKGDFVIQSSTSVASVKGTDFWFISDPATGDMLIGLEGLINLTNLLSGESSDVGAGITGTSSPDGSVGTEDTNPDNIPDDPGEGESSGIQIEIELEGPDGELKTILIDIQ
ncbi:MAG TPA: FecR family protein [Candidatus Marinimicrobia bacterium]|jgi:hypothetical protein|nr:hypothetical protein [Candidatus Pelagibacter sp.]MDP6275482.1 FecR family protein [Candidatus Neomarinimicrobiota bacterium]MDP7217748.1 FecR family protein [Candidatus Neomarinimicrobiota bacterium]MDP7436623.1 FecR family protein [Candidatus Neomarinimicrobiota bacterium]HJL75593.1 FecR family protein [Candidatus Neomarinimicrobiota bacterium]|tara:strand:- start:9443 stop:10126 length:684 start_codon:yes stop_codon:yes gene_type:complete